MCLLGPAQSRQTSMAWLQDTLLCLQLQEKIRTSPGPLTSGLTKGPPGLGELLFCHPKASCIAHSLVAEEHPGLGSSWTGAGSNTVRDKCTGGIVGRMMLTISIRRGSGLLSSLLFAVSDAGIEALEQHTSDAFWSPPSASPSSSFVPDTPTREKGSHALLLLYR